MAHYHLSRRRALQLIFTTHKQPCLPPPQRRSFSAPPPAAPPSSRWLSDLKARLGKCIIFGLQDEQIEQAGRIAKILAEEWRGLVAGRQGYLVDSGQEGIVRWGEMDCRTLWVRILPQTHNLPLHYRPHSSKFILKPAPPPGHLNNVAYVRFAESSRIHWFYGVPPSHASPAHKQEWLDTCFPRGLGLILKSITIDYKYPLAFPAHFTIYHRLSAPVSPTASPTRLLFSALLLSTGAQRPAARFAEEDIIFDYRVQKAARLPEHMLEMLRGRWEEQERVKGEWEGRAREVEGMVEGLERGSWGREGAVEDMGGG